MVKILPLLQALKICTYNLMKFSIFFVKTVIIALFINSSENNTFNIDTFYKYVDWSGFNICKNNINCCTIFFYLRLCAIEIKNKLITC